MAPKETIAEARKAIQEVANKNPILHHLVESTHADLYKRTTKPCEHCDGTTHYVGRNILPDGRLGLGGLIVCDKCGHYG